MMAQAKSATKKKGSRPPKKAMSKGGKKQAGSSAKKKQGYNARLDESLGSRNKAKGNLASRRRESEGMEKKMGRKKFAAAKTMDKGRKKRRA